MDKNVGYKGWVIFLKNCGFENKLRKMKTDNF